MLALRIEVDASAVDRFVADMRRVARAIRRVTRSSARIEVDVDVDTQMTGSVLEIRPRLSGLRVSS